jgi:hypothetical protein
MDQAIARALQLAERLLSEPADPGSPRPFSAAVPAAMKFS